MLFAQAKKVELGSLLDLIKLHVVQTCSVFCDLVENNCVVTVTVNSINYMIKYLFDVQVRLLL